MSVSVIVVEKPIARCLIQLDLSFLIPSSFFYDVDFIGRLSLAVCIIVYY